MAASATFALFQSPGETHGHRTGNRTNPLLIRLLSRQACSTCWPPSPVQTGGGQQADNDTGGKAGRGNDSDGHDDKLFAQKTFVEDVVHLFSGAAYQRQPRPPLIALDEASGAKLPS